MANKTVYPFGTGGQLPSSIGIINDITTGGANKALSAEMGKILGDVVFPETEIDLTELTVRDCSLGSGKKWIKGDDASHPGKHIAIPIVAGGKYRITCKTSQSTGGWYGWLTSSYSPPVSNGQTTTYASGVDRVWLLTGSTVQIAPADASWLIICPVDGAGKSSTWSVSDVENRTNAVDELLQKVNELDENKLDIAEYGERYIYPDFVFSDGAIAGKVYQGTQAGGQYSQSGWSATSYIDINRYKKILFLGMNYTTNYSSTIAVGYYFYDKDKNPLSGSVYNTTLSGTSRGEPTPYELEIPDGAYYFRCSVRNSDGLEIFYCKLAVAVFEEIYEEINKLGDVSIDSEYKSILLGSRYVYGTRRPKPNFNLIHFSDIHGDEISLQKIVDFKNEYNGQIDDILHTGDNVWYMWSHGMTFWDNVEGSSSILNCIGNHDTSNSGGYTYGHRTAQECRERYITPYLSNWGNVQINNDVCYYYKDYEGKDIRLIVLDLYHWDANQLDWLVATLASSLTNNKHVILAGHSPEASYGAKTLTPFDSIEMPESYDMASTLPCINNSAINAVADFIENGGIFVCYLCGHMHRDIMRYFNGHSNMLSVSIENASVLAHVPSATTDTGPNNTSARIIGEISEQCFNVVSVDTNNKILTIIRIGKNYDSYGRHIGSITYDYNNNEIISQR